MLQTMITNTLQAAQASSHGHGNNNSGTRQGKPFLGRPQKPQLSAGKDGTIDPEKNLPLLQGYRDMTWITACIYNARRAS